MTDEDSYWWDFIRGNPLGKYGEIRTVSEWLVDKLVISEKVYGS
jgi:hypothetical protein